MDRLSPVFRSRNLFQDSRINKFNSQKLQKSLQVKYKCPTPGSSKHTAMGAEHQEHIRREGQYQFGPRKTYKMLKNLLPNHHLAQTEVKH